MLEGVGFQGRSLANHTPEKSHVTDPANERGTSNSAGVNDCQARKVRQQINQKTGETSLKKVNLEKILTVFIEGRQITSDEKEGTKIQRKDPE